MPTLSVIITAHDEAQALADNLPLILSQDYPAGFEIIVVNAASTDDTEDVLKRLKAENSNLYSTFTPDSSRYMSRSKLAITLGVKAAKNEWIVLTNADCKPESNLWLQTMAKNCTDSNDIILGHSNYESLKGSFNRFIRFERTLTEYYLFREAQTGCAYRTNGTNIAFRKSTFMNHNGFQSNLRYIRGEYDFLVNVLASPERTAIETCKDSYLKQEEPSRKMWRNKNIFYMETRKHLKRNFIHRAAFNFDTFMLMFNYIILISAIAVSITFSMWIITAAACFSLIMTFILRTLFAQKALRMFNEQFPYICIIPYEIRIPFQKLNFKFRYGISDKQDFIRK